VRAGLTAEPKTLPPRYFYDALGACLFEAICRLPEYYLTRAEDEILRTHLPAILDRAWPATGREGFLVEFGAGSATKTRHVIGALLERCPELHYFPIDVSEPTLTSAARSLLQDHPSLRVTGIAGEFADVFATLGGALRERAPHAPLLALFLGSTIGNFEPHQAPGFLADVRSVLRPGDALLLGADLAKPAAEVLPGYDDALGVTAAFNLNLLLRINRELGGDFDLASFRHHARLNEERSRVEMHLVSQVAQRVTIRALGLELAFREGESIHTENSYKYSEDDLRALAASGGFELAAVWRDRAQLFQLGLLRATAPRPTGV
jgi:dimethylhistidine N-methyltransferase